MNFDKNNICTLIDEWFDFREESLSVLDFDDKKHIVYFDEHADNILRNVSDNNKKFVKRQLFELDTEFADYTCYWNRKYYMQGFKDAMKLILFGISE